jgi:hypothetical protein
MEENLESAPHSILEGEISPKETALLACPETINIHNLGGLVLERDNRAKEYLCQGRWAEYERALEVLEEILKENSRLMKQK